MLSVLHLGKNTRIPRHRTPLLPPCGRQSDRRGSWLRGEAVEIQVLNEDMAPKTRPAEPAALTNPARAVVVLERPAEGSAVGGSVGPVRWWCYRMNSCCGCTTGASVDAVEGDEGDEYMVS